MPEIEEAEIEVSDAIDNFKVAFDDISSNVIGREREVSALKLCVLSGEHLMLDGLHGLAKSQIATEFAQRITGARFFKKQLKRYTQSDELFGPMIANEYKKGIWRHNTAGMLPEAHFAYLDEVPRANDSVLSGLLDTLNERTFNNGTQLMHCPLITAIGTANNIDETEDLRAFYDRWLIWVKVEPLKTSRERIAAMQSFSRSFEQEEDEAPSISTVSLAEIRLLRRHLKKIVVSADVLDLYEETVREYKKSLGSFYISDRRLCKATLLMRAQALLDKTEEVGPSHIEVCARSLSLGDESKIKAFESACLGIIGDYEARAEDRAQLKQLEELLSKARRNYDSDMPLEKATKLQTNVSKMLETLRAATVEERPKSTAGMESYDLIIKEFESLQMSLSEVLSKDRS
jgi:MoxR-like ATPase